MTFSVGVDKAEVDTSISKISGVDHIHLCVNVQPAYDYIGFLLTVEVAKEIHSRLGETLAKLERLPEEISKVVDEEIQANAHAHEVVHVLDEDVSDNVAFYEDTVDRAEDLDTERENVVDRLHYEDPNR